MRVLIPEKQTQNVLAAVRSLVRNDHFVVSLANSDGRQRSMLSRYVHKIEWAPPVTDDPAAFVDRINDVARWYDVVLPFSHGVTSAISYYRDRLTSPCPTPPYDVFKFAHDKSMTMARCNDLGIPCPKTYHIAASDGGLQPEFPCVVKARKNCGVDTGVRYVRSRDELHMAVSDISAQPDVHFLSEYSDPIVQEYIPGPTHDCVGIFDVDRPVTLFTQERVETTPISGGVGAYNVGRYNYQIAMLTVLLLYDIGWRGPFQAEWKFDQRLRSREFKLIELNPKMWGTMALAMKAGLNIPRLAIDLALGALDGACYPRTSKVKMVWPSLVLDNLFHDPSPRRLAMLLYRPIDFKDPVPDVCVLGAVFRRNLRALVKRGLSRGRGGI